MWENWGVFCSEVFKDTDLGVLRGCTLSICPLNLRSVGELTLNKTHPQDQPSIDPHYLEDLHDMEAFKKAIRVLQKIGN